MRALTSDDVPVKIADDNVELRMTEVGEMTVSFIRLRKGTDLGPALKGRHAAFGLRLAPHLEWERSDG